MVQVQIAEFRLLGRHPLSFVRYRLQVRERPEVTERRICLLPDARVEDVLAVLRHLVEVADDPRISRTNAVINKLRQNVLRIIRLSRYDHEQRLGARAHRGVENVIEFSVLCLRELVEDDEGRVQAVLRPALAGHRAIEAAVRVARDGLGRVDTPKDVGQFRIGPHDLRSDLVDLRGLLTVVRRGVDFTVLDRLRPDQVYQHQGSDQRRLTVLSRDRENGAPDDPQARLTVRLVDVPDEFLLPLTKLEPAALSFAGRDD